MYALSEAAAWYSFVKRQRLRELQSVEVEAEGSTSVSARAEVSRVTCIRGDKVYSLEA
ncbi:hypothetical protein NL676_034990, partial [Syzygium grande]